MKYKFFFILFIILFHPIICLGQPMEFEDQVISLEIAAGQGNKLSVPFKKIRIIDKRFDTVKLGYGLFGNRGYRNIKFDQDIATTLENFCNQDYSLKGHDKEMVIILKSLWLQQIKAGEKKLADIEDDLRNISQCFIKADVYAFGDDHYQALIRIDTLIESFSPINYYAPFLIKEAFDRVVTGINDFDMAQLSKRKLIPYSEVINYYDRRFIPLISRPKEMKRGIFLSFKDFLSNKPANYKFSLEQDNESDYLYIEENGEEKLFTDFWGFCDGENNYIRVGFNFFQLNFSEKSFDFWGCQQAVHATKRRSKNQIVRYFAFGALANTRNARLKNIMRPMYLDMDTGLAY